MIDAHAGGLGCLGGDPPSAEDGIDVELPIDARLALIAGTSTCHMGSSSVPVFVPGVWGPYASAMVPGFFLNEGGQSAAGMGIDFVVETHVGFPALQRLCGEEKRPTEVLNARLASMAEVR